MILLIAFVVVGPEDLPKVAVWIARLFRRLRSIMREIKTQTGLDELEREIADTKKDINRDLQSLKSEVDISREINDVNGKLNSALNETDNEVRKE